MQKKTRKIVIILGITLACLMAIAMIFPVVFFIAWIFIAPIIALVLFPFYITFKFIDILYLALTSSLLLSLSLALALKYKSKVKPRFNLLFSALLFMLIYFSASKYLAEYYISSFAIEKYNQEAEGVSLNFKSWYKVGPSDFIGLPGHDRHLGHAHGYIFIDSCKSNWSFFKRDFIKGYVCDNSLNTLHNSDVVSGVSP